MQNFSFVKASSLPEAVELLHGGEERRAVAGGTDLIPLMKDEIVSPSTVVELDFGWEITTKSGELHIGALAPLGEVADALADSREYRALAEACRVSATPQLRNMGTLGGN